MYYYIFYKIKFSHYLILILLINTILQYIWHENEKVDTYPINKTHLMLFISQNNVYIVWILIFFLQNVCAYFYAVFFL